MRRRRFLSGALSAGTAGVGAAALAGSFPKPSLAQDRIEWRMVTAWPKGLPGLGSSAERLAERIGRLSAGRLTIKVFAGGELISPLQGFAAVSQGMAEMAHDFSLYHIGEMPAAAFFSAVPFGLTPSEFNGWMNFAGGQELWDELYDPAGIKPFLAGNTGVQMGGWFLKEINSTEDLKGRRISIPGYGGEALKKLGAEIVTLSSGELFGSLQEGSIDGAEWIGPYNDLSLGLYKITKLYYWPGFQEPGTGLECMVDKGKFSALPDDLQQIVAAACMAENDLTAAEYSGRSPGALATLVNEYGVELKKFSRDVLVAFGNASSEVIAQVLEDGDDITKRIVGSYLRHRKTALPWSRVSERGFLAARDLGFDFPDGSTS
ncbi:MAG: TRAP transporter substrate-binding protein [Rhodospirillaceae bacterium]|nr:TRAP transporter substrate-binding protein [Rhodospirillaceae bacterium]